MTSDSNVPAIGEQVVAYLEAAGLRSPRIKALSSGAQSVCYLIGEQNRPPAFVLKRFGGKKAFHSPDSAGVEYEALCLLYKEVSKLDGLSVPEPLLLLDDRSGYLMRRVDGQPLGQVLVTNHPGLSEYRLIAHRLINGLRAYYLVAGKPYYDFHPGNVLLSREFKVVMLDPTLPSPTSHEIANSSHLGFISADLGYWLHSLATTGARGGVLRRAWWLLLRLTEQLFRMANREGPSSETHALLSDAFRIAGKHGKSLVAGNLRRDVPAGLVTLAVLKGMLVVSRPWIEASDQG